MEVVSQRGFTVYTHAHMNHVYLLNCTAWDLLYALSTAHTTAFDGPVVDHWVEWKIAQTVNASTMQDRSAMQEDSNLYS